MKDAPRKGAETADLVADKELNAGTNDQGTEELTPTSSAAGPAIEEPKATDEEFGDIDLSAPPKITSTPILEHSFYLVPDEIELKGIVRDFNDTHVDFEANIPAGVMTGLVNNQIGIDRKPVHSSTETSGTISSDASFLQWFNDVPGVNLKTDYSIVLAQDLVNKNLYTYSNTEFFPIDNLLLGNQLRDNNYHFTYELHHEFTYSGGEIFSFTGDDDVWVFINDKLVVDLGGIHIPSDGNVALDDLGLTAGENYRFDMFFCERHTDKSSFKIQTSIKFNETKEYQYQVNAEDNNPDEILVYSLVNSPNAVKIDPETGLISISVSDLVQGDVEITVVVTNSRKKTDEQNFKLSIKAI